MSATAAIRYLLATDVSVLAVVPATRIVVAPNLAVGTLPPALNIRQISGVESTSVAMEAGARMRVERVQVTAYAKDYATLVDLLELVRAACVPKPGTVNSVAVDSILPAGEGPDLSDPSAGIFEQSRDFIVRWHG